MKSRWERAVGSDPYPRPFRGARDRDRLLATYATSPQAGMPHVVVRRDLPAAPAMRDSTRAAD